MACREKGNGCVSLGFSVGVARHGLEYLDTFAITRDIFELTFDGGHYGDPAARALAQAVERWLEGVLS